MTQIRDSYYNQFNFDENSYVIVRRNFMTKIVKIDIRE